MPANGEVRYWWVALREAQLGRRRVRVRGHVGDRMQAQIGVSEVGATVAGAALGLALEDLFAALCRHRIEAARWRRRRSQGQSNT